MGCSLMGMAREGIGHFCTLFSGTRLGYYFLSPSICLYSCPSKVSESLPQPSEYSHITQHARAGQSSSL